VKHLVNAFRGRRSSAARSTIWPESGHSLKDWVYDFGTCSGRKS